MDNKEPEITEKRSINTRDDCNARIRQLEKQLAWYKSFFDNATDAVFIVQPETWSVLDANEYSAVLLGIPREEVIGTSLPQFRRIFKLLKKTNSPVVLSELSLDTPEHPHQMVEVSARFMEYEGQKLIQAIARDVSEQRELTDKLVFADKLVMLGQMSASVSHEIRNPLAAVNLNLQILQRNIPETAKEFSYIKLALEGAERISRTVERTLNYSSPSLPDIHAVSLNNIVQAALNMLKGWIKRKEIKIDLQFDKDLPRVAIDGKQIQQVFMNLIRNAVDSITTRGTVTIKSYTESFARRGAERRYAVVAVCDDGCGISPEDLTKIFNPFFTRKSDGTGLGLPITQRILHYHNGIIDVESNLGEGTTFYVKLPVNTDNK
ncbi:MAG: two-component system sensor histidine kinase NtrB [Candidatus Kapaibacterium sp.]